MLGGAMLPFLLLLLRHRRHVDVLRLSRGLHSAGGGVDATHPAYIIWGANTGVGKTVVSAGLAAAVLRPSTVPSAAAFLYLKPLQTGFPRDSDARSVIRAASGLFRQLSPSSALLASHHVLRASSAAARDLPGAASPEAEEQGSNGSCWYEETRVGAAEGAPAEFKLVCKTLYGWREAVSPHLAAEREGMAVSDMELRETLERCLLFGLGEEWRGRKEGVWKIIETAGGVASPGPWGTLQCDVYRFACISFAKKLCFLNT